jgi:hypothetical protein
MKKRNFLVPVLKENGKLANSWYSYYQNRGKDSDRILVPNFEIDLKLWLTAISPTRGSFRAVLQDRHGHNYYMMGSDFNSMLERMQQNITFEGRFTVAHKSYDYTLRLVDLADDEPLNEARMIEMARDGGHYV